MRDSREMEVVHKEKGVWELDGSPLLWMRGYPLLWTGNPQQRVGEGVINRVMTIYYMGGFYTTPPYHESKLNESS